MAKLSDEINADIENIDIVLGHIQNTIQRKDRTIIELTAMAAFIHSFYNGIENILKRILKTKNIIIKETASWHKDLLNLAVTEGLISEEISDELYKYLTFRHYFLHNYGFMIEEDQLLSLIKNINKVWENVLKDIKKLL